MKVSFVVIAVLIAASGLYYGFYKSHTRVVSPISTEPGTIRYLPLGDSYTIGESVAEPDRWPNQLVARLQKDGQKIVIVANPSVTGYTTQNLIDRELPLVDQLQPDFTSLQIGVNDYVQGVDATTFRFNLNRILDSLQSKIANPKRILLVTIPDYGKTPTGARFGAPAVSEAGIKQFNEIISQAATDRGLALADIFAISQTVVNDATLTAPDGLHPSGKQYGLWTELLYQKVAGNYFKA